MNQTWFSEIRFCGEVERLFESLIGIQFFMKTASLNLIRANQLFAQHAGFETIDELIGKTDFDIFPHHLAKKYHDDDLQILKTGKAMENIVELFLGKDKLQKIFLTHKYPLFNTEGKTHGIIGIIQAYQIPQNKTDQLSKIEEAFRYIQKNHTSKILIPHVARIAGFSLRQFERLFLDYYKMSPRDYLVKMRIATACEQLKKTKLSISEIAHMIGFYDHSCFVKMFKKQVGITPKNYRKVGYQ